MFYITLNDVQLSMFVGIRDFEYLSRQPVVVNVKLYGSVPLQPRDISECLDYTKVTDYLKSWEKREHVDLVETLLFDLLNFCFEDSRIIEVEAEVLKPAIIDFTSSVGVGMKITKELFNLKKNNKEKVTQ